MHSLLVETDKIFRQIEPYIRPKHDMVEAISKGDLDLSEFDRERQDARMKYTDALKKLDHEYSDLSVQDIVDAFENGVSDLLKEHLIGIVLSQFHDDYIPIVKQVIMDDHPRAYLLLKKLSDSESLSDKEMVSLLKHVIVSSEHRHTIQRALIIIQECTLTALRLDLENLAKKNNDFRQDVNTILNNF